mmetsp:Transcript_8261/g.21329  ORF Transcript_8261/g.21329 Transcript_8261/m.21329 type:complete len:255 (-) Transcript_8261:70-834(-)
MQTQLARHRHLVHHEREHALLHLTRVLRAEHDHLSALEVEVDRARRRHAIDIAVRREGARVIDDEVRDEVVELILRAWDEHVPHEERVVRPRAHDADLHAVVLVMPSIRVNHKETLLRAEVVDRALAVDHERLVRERDVDRAPPDVVLRGVVLDDALILGRAAGLGPRAHRERACRGEVRGVALVAEGELDDSGGRRVADQLRHGVVIVVVVVQHFGLHRLVVLNPLGRGDRVGIEERLHLLEERVLRHDLLAV